AAAPTKAPSTPPSNTCMRVDSTTAPSSMPATVEPHNTSQARRANVRDTGGSTSVTALASRNGNSLDLVMTGPPFQRACRTHGPGSLPDANQDATPGRSNYSAETISAARNATPLRKVRSLLSVDAHGIISRSITDTG